MYFLLLYELADGYLEKRTAYRSKHFDHIKAAQANGDFMMGGAFDTEKEAALIFKTTDKSVVEKFVKADPYVIAGVVTGWRIEKWNVVVGG